MTPEYKPEPITEVKAGDTVPVDTRCNLALEFMDFAVNTSRFLMQYTDFINRFMEEATKKTFRQLECLVKGLDPNDPVTAGVAESIEQAKMLYRIHKERIQAEEGGRYELDQRTNPLPALA